MPWVKIDDKFPDHWKVAKAGPLAGWLFVCGLAYCNRMGTDGFIRAEVVRRLADVDEPLELAARLVDAGLWEATEDGYRVHDYLDYQPSREHSEAVSQARAEAGRKGGQQKASNLLERGQTPPASKPLAKVKPVPVPLNSLSKESVADAAAPLPTPPPKKPTRTREPAPRKPGWVECHPFFAPLVAQFGRPGGAEWSLWGKELTTLIEKTNDVPPEATAKEIPRRVRQWPKVMGVGADGTPLLMTLPGFVKHWHSLAPGGSPNGTAHIERPAYHPDPELKALVQQSLGRGPRAPNDVPGL